MQQIQPLAQEQKQQDGNSNYGENRRVLYDWDMAEYYIK